MTEVDSIPTVAVFVAHYPPMGGGIARLASTTFYGISEQNCRVIFVTARYSDKESEFEYINENVSVYRLPVYKIYGYKRYPVFKKNTKFRDVIKRLGDMKIDRVVVLTRFHLTSHIGTRFGRVNSIPTYLLECSGAPLTLRNKFLDIPLRLIENTLSKNIFKKVDHFYAMSKAAREFLLRRYNIQTKDSLWSCSINTDMELVKRVDPDKVVITYSGRIENLKGEESLVKAFMQLVGDYENLHLNFVGTGSYLKTLKDNFKHKNITYWGEQDIGKINDILNMSDISVCATTFPDGAVPNSVLEAGAQKCAMICSPNGGFLEIIKNGVNGILTDEKVSVESMTQSIKLLIDDVDLRKRLSDRIFHDILEDYSQSSVSKRVVEDLGLR